MEQKQCSLKDARILLMNEILQGIKVKLYFAFGMYAHNLSFMVNMAKLLLR